MENTGSGVSESTMEKVSTAAHSTHSAKKGKRNTTKTEKPTTPAEAGELLLSALDYCKKAGLSVTTYNDGGLVLFVEGLKYEDRKIVPVVTPIPADVTPNSGE